MFYLTLITNAQPSLCRFSQGSSLLITIMCRFLTHVTQMRKEWIYIHLCPLGNYESHCANNQNFIWACPVPNFTPKWTKNIENAGKSPFMSSPKALISSYQFSGNSKTPTVLPGGLLCHFSPKSVNKHGKWGGKKFTDDLKQTRLTTPIFQKKKKKFWKRFVRKLLIRIS